MKIRVVAHHQGEPGAGLNAHSKGVSLGLFTPSPKEIKEKRKKLCPKETITVDLLHLAVPAERGEPVEPGCGQGRSDTGRGWRHGAPERVEKCHDRVF